MRRGRNGRRVTKRRCAPRCADDRVLSVVSVQDGARATRRFGGAGAVAVTPVPAIRAVFPALRSRTGEAEPRPRRRWAAEEPGR